ncbi:MAG: aldo/keto reductase [Candidatus Hydrogenedentes bacterium]|nr:aldo/keto reductase [Candidatus Hydrogenedentota bacterium]
MHKNPSETVMDRRDFLKSSAALAAATAGASALGAAQEPTPARKTPGSDGLIHRNERPSMAYRKLGRTNFLASRLVFGCGAALSGGRGVHLLERAFEAGVNYYDNGSNLYYRGSEKAFAPFLRAHRDDVWIASKAPLRLLRDLQETGALSLEDAKSMAAGWTRLLEASLKDLETDYVDAYYLMAVSDPPVVACEELYAAFTRARDAGKVGHFGLSTHKRAKEVLEAAIETGWYDIAMVAVTPAGWYDWDSRSLLAGTPPMTELRPLLDRARDAGLGLVGMKAGRFLTGPSGEAAFDSYYEEGLLKAGLNAYQRAYAYVLEHGVDVVNADMQNFTHLEENLVAAARAQSLFA